MLSIKRLAENRPFIFVIALFLVQSLFGLPFVVAFKIAGLDITPLRLFIPFAESILMLWLIWSFGWLAKSGVTGPARNLHLLWYPVLLAFLPAVIYGTIVIPAGWILFYAVALVFTGISEEAFARGLILPSLLPKGKWLALFFAAALFSAGHITNIFFEEFSAVEWFEKFAGTFGFAVLYGALFLRTGSLWPLILLHMIHDYSYLTSGTAGPFIQTPFSIPLGIGLAVLNVAYGIFIMQQADRPEQISDA